MYTIKIGKLSTKRSLLVVVIGILLLVAGVAVGLIVMYHTLASTKSSSVGSHTNKGQSTSRTSTGTPASGLTTQDSNSASASKTSSGATSSSQQKGSSSKGGTSTSSGTTSSTSGSGGSSGSGGGASQNPPSPPGPLTAITVTNMSAVASPVSATRCDINQSVTFSTNGSGSVSVTWQVFSGYTSSAYYNPTAYTFSSSGSQTDSSNSSWQGLEPGDSYRVRAILTGGSVTQIAGPVTIGSCAGPQSLLTANQPSYMSSPVVGTGLVVNQTPDSLFTNSCSMNLQASFSVSGPGSVQPVYTITSGSSIGATLYSQNQWSFTGPGSATDSSYIRMPHLPSGSYNVSVKLNVLGDPAHSSTYGPVVSACS